MLVRFWGTRGSIPVALSGNNVRNKIRNALVKSWGRRFVNEAAIDQFIEKDLTFAERSGYGGNSSCVQIDAAGSNYIICDMGSGLREFGNRMLAIHGPGKPQTYHIFLSHVHWDHIMGFPFFVPAYIPGNKIFVHGCHKHMELALRRQHTAPSFPVEYEKLGATIEYVTMEPGEVTNIGDVTVKSIAQYHEGESYGYRFEKAGKSVVYSTDSEHKFDQHEMDENYPFVGFFKNADLVIFDAMYTLADAISIKSDWGHSSNIVAVELCHLAEAKQLVLFHHEPNFDDATIDKILAETVRFEEISRTNQACKVVAAYDGLEIRL